MNSLERVVAAMKNTEPDRIPFDLGSSLVTGITKTAYINLARAMGEDPGEIEFYDTVQQLPVLSESIIEKLEVDVRGVIPNFVRRNPPVEDVSGVPTFMDEYGVKWTKSEGAGYFSVAESPFRKELSAEAIDDFPWPDPKDPALIAGLAEQARSYHDRGYAVIMDSLCAGLFEMCCRVRGTEQFYMDMAMEPDVAGKLLDKFVELKIGFYEAAAESIGPYIQFVREGDDMAGQEALLFSPRMYHDLLKPRHRQLFEAQKRLFPQPFYCFFHSDGAIWNLIPTFIEIGVDVLNPVQLTAKDMDADHLKAEFGKDLRLWGGGVDTQHVLPHATPDEVKAEVKSRVASMAGGGGYIFGGVHNIQDDVPPENVLAMMDAFREVREY